MSYPIVRSKHMGRLRKMNRLTGLLFGLLFQQLTQVRAAELWLPFPVTSSPYFGRAVAISGDRAVVGANGAAYVFLRQGDDWLLEQKLSPDDDAVEDPDWSFTGPSLPPFGASIAIDGDLIAVAAAYWYSQPAKIGAVFIFARKQNGWIKESVITSSEPEPFGLAVALEKRTLLVGATENRLENPCGQGTDSGLAYVFVRTGAGWKQEAKLMSGDTVPIQCEAGEFRSGASVSLSRDTAVVGASLYLSPVHGPGSAYIFSRSGQRWVQEGRLDVVPYATPSGITLSLHQESLVIGDSISGQVFLYQRDGSAWTQALHYERGAPNRTLFGQSVAVRDGALLISAPRDYIFLGRYQSPQPGGALLDFWDPVKGYEGHGAYWHGEFDRELFGWAVALGEGTAIIGAPGGGEAFIFDVPAKTRPSSSPKPTPK